MNLEKLKQAQDEFLSVYPQGFNSPELQKIGKKHPIDKMHKETREQLAKSKFKNFGQIVYEISRIVSRSSMVSLFEKPKFRDFLANLPEKEQTKLAAGYYDLLYGNQKDGFNTVCEILTGGKLAKWSLVTIVPFYFDPQNNIFIKPTTTKNAIEFFELQGLKYTPKPNYEFWINYKKAIDKMTTKVEPSLFPNYAAFTGFLMHTCR